jgi:hypothetical protein
MLSQREKLSQIGPKKKKMLWAIHDLVEIFPKDILLQQWIKNKVAEGCFSFDEYMRFLRLDDYVYKRSDTYQGKVIKKPIKKPNKKLAKLSLLEKLRIVQRKMKGEN